MIMMIMMADFSQSAEVHQRCKLALILNPCQLKLFCMKKISKHLAQNDVCQAAGEMAKTKRLLDFEISSWDSDHYFIGVGNLKL